MVFVGGGGGGGAAAISYSANMYTNCAPDNVYEQYQKHKELSLIRASTRKIMHFHLCERCDENFINKVLIHPYLSHSHLMEEQNLALLIRIIQKFKTIRKLNRQQQVSAEQKLNNERRRREANMSNVWNEKK